MTEGGPYLMSQLKDPGSQETAMDAVTQSKAKAGKGKAGGKNGQDARAA